MRQRTEDDEYFDKVQALSERLSGEGADEAMRLIAREEANKRIEAYLGPLLFIAALWVANDKWGGQGFWVVIALTVAWFMWTIFRMDWDPAHERHLVVMKAEDLNRLTVLAEAYEAGEQVWSIKEKAYDRDERKVEIFDGDRWDGSWERVYRVALEFENLSPRKREKRLMEAAKRAKSALEHGEALGKRDGAELTFWARRYLQKLKG